MVYMPKKRGKVADWKPPTRNGKLNYESSSSEHDDDSLSFSLSSTSKYLSKNARSLSSIVSSFVTSTVLIFLVISSTFWKQTHYLVVLYVRASAFSYRIGFLFDRLVWRFNTLCLQTKKQKSNCLSVCVCVCVCLCAYVEVQSFNRLTDFVQVHEPWLLNSSKPFSYNEGKTSVWFDKTVKFYEQYPGARGAPCQVHVLFL